MPRTLPYGTWPSSISAADLAAFSPRLGGARFVGDDIWWDETVSAEQGRVAILRASDGAHVLPAPWSARTRVHEYGGIAWTTTDSGDLVFVEASDQRIYRLTPGETPRALTPEALNDRYAELMLDGDTLYAVRERARDDRGPSREIVSLAADGSSDPVTVVAGSDFIAYPTVRAGRLAWMAWNHPDMPWDASEVRVGAIVDGVVTEFTTITGGRADTPEAGPVSALQPVWETDDTLLVAADPPIKNTQGAPARWNLQRLRLDEADSVVSAERLHSVDADTGGALWSLGSRWFAPLDDGRILAVETNGRDRLVIIPKAGDDLVELETPLDEVLIRDVRGSRALLLGAGAATPGGIWELDIEAHTVKAIRGGEHEIDPSWFSTAQPISFAGPAGDIHAFAYPPTHPDVEGPDGELPPYVVFVHGGPTGHVAGVVSLKISYLTSRGIGVLDVNYGGSSGYGRAYRERLIDTWGIADVADVVVAARGFADAGLADTARLAIAGGSAGGWTALCALADSDVFTAGIDRYGVADLRALAAETHDFESRYLDSLVGPLPEAEAIYIERSPLSRPESLTTPLLVLQGVDDPVVPPSQSHAIVEALARNGTPHAYLEFEGESHGFRQRETIIRVAETEVAFLGAVWGFDAEGIEPLDLTVSEGDATV